MLPLQQFSAGVIAGLIRRQPESPARTMFAWQQSVGPAVAAATSVTLERGVLRVRARDARWAIEVQRAADTILGRLRRYLGDDAVLRIEVSASGRRPG